MSLVEKICDGIYRFTNQTFYGEPVGTYLVKLADTLLLIDLPVYTEEIETLLKSYKLPCECILSHGSCGIADGKIWQERVGLKIFLHKADHQNEWLYLKPDILFKEPPTFAPHIKVIHTPGHKPGCICVLETKTKTLFAGDTIGGHNGKVIDMQTDIHDDDTALRIESCRNLLQYNFENILPFHDESIIGNAHAALEEYLALIP